MYYHYSNDACRTPFHDNRIFRSGDLCPKCNKPFGIELSQVHCDCGGTFYTDQVYVGGMQAFCAVHNGPATIESAGQKAQNLTVPVVSSLPRNYNRWLFIFLFIVFRGIFFGLRWIFKSVIN